MQKYVKDEETRPKTLRDCKFGYRFPTDFHVGTPSDRTMRNRADLEVRTP